ncbi:hypothetical protein [Virgisporangium aurantiacum]|uniref:Uncharacterized protein n=1 Tax=Virgisporangium aurantiacum TaxID=175570 RepID=A0A8J4E814_9ACTN|nr:hypothetical protein [Virgisporangium aurantiacum]GIJ64884.1 hypothetical protein Vau01_124000 [Virgisporangium aurantiacum]
MARWLLHGFLDELAVLVAQIIGLLWKLLSATAFTTPDVTTVPQVMAMASNAQTLVDVTFAVAILTAGALVMGHGTVQTRYGVGELAPRLVIGFIAANFAIPICRTLIDSANAITEALTVGDLSTPQTVAQLQDLIGAALGDQTNGLLALIAATMLAVLTAMLLATWLIRIGLLVVLVGIAPIALACHATPFTDPAARLWWRAVLGTLATVVLQVLALSTTMMIFLDPRTNNDALGVPQDPTGTIRLFIVVCLLWVTIRIPGLMRRYVTRGGSGPNVVGMVLRMVTIQRVTGLLRLPVTGRAAAGAAGRAASATAGRAGAGAAGAAATRLPRQLGPAGPSMAAGPSIAPGPAGAARRTLPPPRGAGQGRVARAWPSGRPVWPYTREELAAGVDPYTRTVPRRTPPPARPASSRPPIRARGTAPPPSPAGPRPAIPPGVTPATAMPPTRPKRPPIATGLDHLRGHR